VHEADHSPPSIAEVKNAWIYTTIPQYAFMAWCSAKAPLGNLQINLPTEFKASVALFTIFIVRFAF
jgi:hypothetical protein